MHGPSPSRSWASSSATDRVLPNRGSPECSPPRHRPASSQPSRAVTETETMRSRVCSTLPGASSTRAMSARCCASAATESVTSLLTVADASEAVGMFMGIP